MTPPILILALTLLDGGAPRPSPSPSPSATPSPMASPTTTTRPSPRARSIGERARTASPRPGAPDAKVSPKVFTNTDLADRDRAAVSTLAAGEDGQPVAAPGENTPPEAVERIGGGEDQTFWFDRAEEVRERIRAANERIVEIEEKLARLRDDVAPEDPMNPFRLQAREGEMAELNRQLEEARTELATAQQDMTNLEDEARRKGAPPGWLRPRGE